MGPAVLFLLVIVAAAPLIFAAQSLDYYSTAKPSTTWVNSDIFFHSPNYYSHNIFTIVQPQAQSGITPYIAAGFFCVNLSLCDEFIFGVSIATFGETGPSVQPQIIWSANWARPVGMNATLQFIIDGNLVLCDADGSHVWSSNTSGQSVGGMKITEIGNLVLFDHRNATVWQSFDNPNDTLVPGQSLSEGMRLTTTTSAGSIYITVIRNGLAAYAGSTPPQQYFQFNISRDEMPIGNYLTKLTLMNGSLSFGSNLGISVPFAKSTWYMRLDSDGYLRLYELSDSGTSWMVLYDIMGSMGMDVCDYPTVCGEYGVCTGGQCTCPIENNSSSNYFKPVDERKSNLGCKPLIPISCQEIQDHHILTISNVSYFDNNHTVVNATSVDACKQACLKNCSCMAVLFRDKQCVWVTKVFSMKSMQTETIGSESTAYLKVQLSSSNENKKEEKRKMMFGATLGAVTTIVFLVIVAALYLRRRRKYEEKDEEFEFDHFPGMPTRFTFEMLRECTEGFGRKLGEGGFGSVFEGKIGEDRVAVKRLEGARQGKKEFLAEVETIGSIEHINLVRLVGFCAEKSERLLVYEYVSRGSLDRWIYYRHKNAPLDWCTRCRIILDIAKGLCYLHEDCRQKIAHLDIKPQNILLDDNFNAKVADFVLCKLINRDQSKVVTVMRGTPGYLAPECLFKIIHQHIQFHIKHPSYLAQGED